MWPKRTPTNRASEAAHDGPPRLLAIMAANQDRDEVAAFASRSGLELTSFASSGDACRVESKSGIAVIVLDRDLAGDDWKAVVQDLAKQYPAASIILASRVLDDYLFGETVKNGGFDLVAKPIRPDELRRIGGLALTFWRSHC